MIGPRKSRDDCHCFFSRFLLFYVFNTRRIASHRIASDVLRAVCIVQGIMYIPPALNHPARIMRLCDKVSQLIPWRSGSGSGSGRRCNKRTKCSAFDHIKLLLPTKTQRLTTDRPTATVAIMELSLLSFYLPYFNSFLIFEYYYT